MGLCCDTLRELASSGALAPRRADRQKRERAKAGQGRAKAAARRQVRQQCVAMHASRDSDSGDGCCSRGGSADAPSSSSNAKEKKRPRLECRMSGGFHVYTALIGRHGKVRTLKRVGTGERIFLKW